MADETPITILESGAETHESWLALTLSKVSQTPGARLFDSEIRHQHYVVVRIHRCQRSRDLNKDWKLPTQLLMEFSMSFAQWGAFVSAFSDGGGVPATLTFGANGPVPQAPAESRLGESMREVRESGDKALSGIAASYEAVEEAFARGAGKKEMRELLHGLKYQIKNGPANMEFAAKSLTGHVENVVTKAKGDIEAMVASAAAHAGLDAPSFNILEAGDGADEPR